MLNQYKTRFAPSPTGNLHLGNLRAAIMSYLWSLKYDAQFVLRIDDTDTQRSKRDFIDKIFDTLKKLDIKWSYTFNQSSRYKLYAKIFDDCVNQGLVYAVCESSQELEQFRSNMQRSRSTPAFKKEHAKIVDHTMPVYWRFALENKNIIFKDNIKGQVTINLANFSDPVVRKANGDFTYIFASVIDDCIEKITHIIRGVDHLSNTAIQIYIAQQLFKSGVLEYHHIDFAHYPLFVDLQGNKMSKRNREISVDSMLYNFHPLSILHYVVFTSSSSKHHIHDNMRDLSKDFNLNSYTGTNTIAFNISDIYKWQKKIFTEVNYSILSDWFNRDYKCDFSELKENISSREDLQTWFDILNSDNLYSSVFDLDKSALAPLAYNHNAHDLIINKIQQELSQQFTNLPLSTLKILSFNTLRQILTGQKRGMCIQKLCNIMSADRIFYRLKNYRHISLKLTDSINGSKKFVPINPRHVRVYACGPTLYDEPHIGNYRSFITFDILSRLLEYLYPKVTYVRNITDIDDKIINAAAEQGIREHELISKVHTQFAAHNKALCILQPDKEPSVTSHIKQIIEYIKKLYDAGYAYISDDGVYFNIKKYTDDGNKYHVFSKYSNQTVQDDDFVLWKFKNDQYISWNSPWGNGRPGWHIECTVMSQQTLGLPFDIHCGGMDLSFPHHTNEIAQCCAIHDEYARYWLHNNFINFKSNKMSKSLGNILRLSQIKSHPMIIKLAMITTHYRSVIHWSDDLIKQAESIYNKWRRYIGKMLQIHNINLDMRYHNYQSALKSEFIDALLNDINLPLAIRCVDQMITDKEDVVSILYHCNFIGIEFDFEYLKDSRIIDAIVILKKYKTEKKYDAADKIKAYLKELNVVTEELQDSVYWYQYCS